MTTRSTRRAFLQACGAAGVGLALPFSLTACGGSPGGDTPDGGDGVDAASAGAFPVPPPLDGELVDGVRVFRLDVQPGSRDLGAGAPTATYGFNGSYLGPTLRLRRGERVRMEVTNSLAELTSVHWHGMVVPARADGGPYVTIAPGATWVAEYTVDQRPMTAWYHPHPMHATARQVYMGLAGLLYVDDPTPAADLPTRYGVDDLPLVIQDRRLFADGTHPYSNGATPAMHDLMSGLRGDLILVNGVRTPRGAVPRGWVRLRVLNGSNARIYQLGFADGRGFLLVASDGGRLAAPISTTRALVAPGERVELLVDFTGDAPGTIATLQSFSGEVFARLFTGPMGANLSDALDRTTFPIASFEVGDAPGSADAPPAAFEPIVRGGAADAVRTRAIELSMRMGGMFINGVAMTALEPVPAALSYEIPSGSTELWVVTNTSGMAHPLHVHHRAFQVLDVDGAPPPAELAGWKDTVIVAPGQTVRLLIRFEGIADREIPYMFHCHILEHEDHGMMGRFFLV